MPSTSDQEEPARNRSGIPGRCRRRVVPPGPTVIHVTSSQGQPPGCTLTAPPCLSGSRRTRRLPGEAQPTLVPRDASCTDGRTTDTPRDDDTPAAGAESAKPQVNGGVGGARGGIRTPDLPITSQLHYVLVDGLWCCLVPVYTVVARGSCWAVTARDCQDRDVRIHHG